MPLCRINDVILYFAHIPKTGGSSIEDYMSEKGAIALRHNNVGHPAWSKTTPQHMPKSVFQKYVSQDFYDVNFAVLRDPKEKLISTYKMRISRDHVLWNPLNWLGLAWGRLRGRDVYAIPFWRLTLSLDFDTWAWCVTRWMKRKPFIYDGHILPQSDYVVDGQKLFLFEDGLTAVFRWIDDITGTPLVEGSFHQKKGGNFKISCTPRTDAMLARVYAEDYALLERLRRERDAQSGPAVDPGRDVQ